MAGIQITKEAKLDKGSKQEGRHSKGLSGFQLFYGFISPISHSLQKYLTELVCSPRHKKMFENCWRSFRVYSLSNKEQWGMLKVA